MEHFDDSRRAFMKKTLVSVPGLLGASWSFAQGSATSGLLDRTGVALYTVRDLMKDEAKTLQAIAALGYKYVEGGLLPSMGPALKAAGLQQKSAYAPTYLITGNRAAWAGAGDMVPESYTWDQAIAEAKGRGIEYLIVVYLMKAERGGLDHYKALAAKLDKAGEACKKAGLTLAYHPHSFEFEPIDGVRPMELMLKETNPAHLALELDTFWASIAGLDPVALLAAHKGRVPLVHLKDKAKGTANQFDEGKVPAEAFKEIGNGVVDWKAFFPLAAASGVKYLYVEQDQTVGSTPLDSLRTSYANIKKLVG